jgi:hypothetical protein
MARMARDGLLPEHLRPPEQMLIVTTNEIPGYRIIRVHGDVFGLTVRAPAPFSGFAAGVRAAFGDAEMADYTDLLIDSRNWRASHFPDCGSFRIPTGKDQIGGRQV